MFTTSKQKKINYDVLRNVNKILKLFSSLIVVLIAVLNKNWVVRKKKTLTLLEQTLMLVSKWPRHFY